MVETVAGTDYQHFRARVWMATVKKPICSTNFADAIGTFTHAYCAVTLTTGVGDILARRYEETMARLEQITLARYQVEVY